MKLIAMVILASITGFLIGMLLLPEPKATPVRAPAFDVAPAVEVAAIRIIKEHTR
jgi:hypothetical protein